jgi:class 3 adenylate cyclase/tetratricopeptide (TPR) repeat protein
MGCGAALAAPPVERRKLVTSVFCDLSGSTALGEAADAELVFALMRSYFDAARGALERHGGGVEKFIGDAVVGMFGVPEAHEDDALRACRAALEIQDLSGKLGISLRVGVNTGEVVAGDAAHREMFASGDAVVLGDSVNVAARLEQAAAPGEVLIGEETYRLVRGAVRVEPVAPIEAKGKSAPLSAFRLVEVSAHGPLPRQAGTPLVGRRGELAMLEAEFEAATQGCRLATVVGEAGVGKSRIIAELAERIGDRTRIVRGGCLSYGEGITYWPIAQIVRELAGIRDDDTAEQARERVPRRIAQMLALAEGTVSAEQTTEAIAEFLSAAAAERPVLTLVDDIHWAEPALLDLLERLPRLIGEAPVLVLCLARPELLEARPGWPVTLRVEPLDAAEVDALLESLNAPAGTRLRLGLAAAGNPLYAEELVAWVRDGGDAADLPTSLNALLGARLDRLEAGQRDVLERGAVEGELFHESAVVELTHGPARLAISVGLDELTRKDMIRITAASLAGEFVAYRFKHILVRDAAYRGTTKRLRATLHERFADWLVRRAGERVGEYDEILGYHLEQAHCYRIELGEQDDELAARAAAHLGGAGRRAADRADYHAAASLLDRAVKLLPDESIERLGTLVSYCKAVNQLGRVQESRAGLVEVAERAGELGDPVLAVRARNHLVGHRIFEDPEVDLDAERRILEDGNPVLAAAGHETALGEAARQIGLVCRRQGHFGEAAEWLERSLVYARATVDRVSFQQIARSLAHVLVDGPLPVSAATARCEELLEANRGVRMLEATISTCLAELAAMAGAFDEAHAHLREADRKFGDMSTMFAALACSTIAETLALTGDLAGAQQSQETKWRFFSDRAQDARAIDAAEAIACLCCDDRRWDEAERWLAVYSDVPRETPARLAAQARLAAHRADLETAQTLAEHAVAREVETDGPNRKASAWLTLAEVLGAGGRSGEAETATAEALALYAQKGNVAGVERLRARVPT